MEAKSEKATVYLEPLKPEKALSQSHRELSVCEEPKLDAFCLAAATKE
jgi:hypothetical protein